ncbi:hypothetical protein Scep_003863 [Stephania cephalantha]|uniref:Uncharacterized protein n=1 Tax=Stephania cephalantha TaxID=152367 RepID=A0AAP0KU41_9MAGN
MSNPSRRRASSTSQPNVHCYCVSSGINQSSNAPPRIVAPHAAAFIAAVAVPLLRAAPRLRYRCIAAHRCRRIESPFLLGGVPSLLLADVLRVAARRLPHIRVTSRFTALLAVRAVASSAVRDLHVAREPSSTLAVRHARSSSLEPLAPSTSVDAYGWSTAATSRRTRPHPSSTSSLIPLLGGSPLSVVSLSLLSVLPFFHNYLLDFCVRIKPYFRQKLMKIPLHSKTREHRV